MANAMSGEKAREIAAQRKTLAGGRPQKRRPCIYCKRLLGAREMQVHISRECPQSPTAKAKWKEWEQLHPASSLFLSDEIPFTHKVSPAALTISIRQRGSKAYCFLRVQDTLLGKDEWLGPEIIRVTDGYDANLLAIIALDRGVQELGSGHEWLSIFTDNDNLIWLLVRGNGKRVWPQALGSSEPILRHDGGKEVEYQNHWRSIGEAMAVRGPNKHTGLSYCTPNNDVRYYEETMASIDNYLQNIAS